MRKTVYLLNVDDYAPEITEITYPAIARWAERIHATEIYVIRDRAFSAWPVTYEKLQIHELARDRDDDWAIYIDSDALLHPELPDMTELLPWDTVAHNGNDWAPVRFDPDEYNLRDGRGIGSCNWFAVASRQCLDLWRPLEISPARAIERIHPTVSELAAGITPEHLVDDFALSNNIARFGLKFTTLMQLWRDHGLVQPDLFHHDYTYPAEQKAERMKETMKRWGV